MGLLSFFKKPEEEVTKKVKPEPKIKVLVLDDDTDLLDTLKLGQYPQDVEMVFSSNPEDVLFLTSSSTFDAIFSDVHMPHQEEVNKRLKELASDIPVYRMSGLASTNFLNLVLRKPFTLDIFEKKIKEIRALAVYLKKTA